jgi:hypothetical protein
MISHGISSILFISRFLTDHADAAILQALMIGEEAYSAEPILVVVINLI